MSYTDQKSKFKDQSQNKNSKVEIRLRAFFLSLKIIRFLSSINYHETSIRIIRNQLIRSITSVGANLVEAKSSASKREYLNYFQISLKSANESKYWLALLRELLPENREDINNFINEAEEISLIIGSSVLTMKGKKKV